MKTHLLIGFIAFCVVSTSAYGVPGDMVLVPAGSFPYQNTIPQVFVETFLIDKYETTNESYCQFLNAADPNAEHWVINMDINRSENPPYSYTVKYDKANYPVRFVSLYDANAFAQWRTTVEGAIYRLPTEQEWEKAAAWDPIEPNYYIYGCHTNSIDCTWASYNPCVRDTTPVGYYNGTGGRNNAKSYYGCYDMCGNVWEWTTSKYDDFSYVVRGGGWLYGLSPLLQTNCRNMTVPWCRVTDGGFRLVRSGQAPIADAGDEQTVYADADFTVDVPLNGSGSSDPDGDELTYTWTWTINSETYQAEGVNPVIDLPVGQHSIELIVNDGQEDSEPDHVVIVVIAPMTADLSVLPRVINRYSNMPNIFAMVRLPAGIPQDQINTEQKLLLYPGGIEATRQGITQSNKEGVAHTSIYAFFEKEQVMSAVPGNGSVELKVVGRLKSGQYFYGTDAIRIIIPGIAR